MISRREFFKGIVISGFGSLLLNPKQVIKRFLSVDQEQQLLSKNKKLSIDDSLFSKVVYYVSANDVWLARDQDVNLARRAFSEFTEVCMSYERIWFDPDYHYVATYFVEKVYPGKDRIDKNATIKQWQQKMTKRMARITPDECCSTKKYTIDQGKTWHIPGYNRRLALSSVDK